MFNPSYKYPETRTFGRKFEPCFYKTMTIEELLKGEEKLNKYKELKQWKDLFEKSKPQIKHSFYHVDSTNVSVGENTFVIPENISNIIISALDAEIKKLDEE